MKTAAIVIGRLFEPVSSTDTYSHPCPESGEVVPIDPVMPPWQRDLQAINDPGPRLMMSVDTHMHEHITAASLSKREIGSLLAIRALDALPCTDVRM